jgi:probable rRNA maturation factor
LSEVSQTKTKTKSTSAESLSRFASRVQRVLGIQGEVNICVTSNREMQSLNRRFRRKNKPTDVLTFPSAMPHPGGDIAISLEIAAANAEQLEHSLDTEVKILILHGMLHLAGYDHEIDDGEMHIREAELRRRLNLPVGLIERAHEFAAKTSRKRRRS